MPSFSDKIVSGYPYEFWKGFSVKHCLVAIFEKILKFCNDESYGGKSFGALLSDLSKEFNCLSHKFLTPKLKPHGFNNVSLNLMHIYLTERKRR